MKKPVNDHLGENAFIKFSQLILSEKYGDQSRESVCG